MNMSRSNYFKYHFQWIEDSLTKVEEKNVQKAIREAAKRNDMGSAKVCLFAFLFFVCDL